MAFTLPNIPNLSLPNLSNINLSSMTPYTTKATALSNLILAIPNTLGTIFHSSNPAYTKGYQPNNPPQTGGVAGAAVSAVLGQQPPALVFHYEGEQTVSLESDITDHYVENNTAIQDQIALKPEVVTTHGFIGELNDVPPPALALLQQTAQALTIISAYTPQLSTTANIAYQTAFQLYQVGANAVNAAVSAWTSLAGTGGESVIGSGGVTSASHQNLQQTYFQQFYGYWRNRTLFTVQTPWAVFQNMAISKLRAIQDAETNMITDFEVTFKMIRMANTVTVPNLSAARSATQSAPVTQLGNSTPSQVPGIPGS